MVCMFEAFKTKGFHLILTEKPFTCLVTLYILKRIPLLKKELLSALNNNQQDSLVCPINRLHDS